MQAKNIFWQSAQSVSIGTGSHFEEIVLGKTNISLGTKASINGRLLAQTAVTLIKSTVVAPSMAVTPLTSVSTMAELQEALNNKANHHNNKAFIYEKEAVMCILILEKE